MTSFRLPRRVRRVLPAWPRSVSSLTGSAVGELKPGETEGTPGAIELGSATRAFPGVCVAASQAPRACLAGLLQGLWR